MNIQTQTLSEGVFRGDICGEGDDEPCNNDNQVHLLSAGSKGQTATGAVENTGASTEVTTSLTGASTAASATTDRFAVEYITDEAITCTGQTISSERQIVQVYFVGVGDDGVSSLLCQAYEATLDFATQNFDTHTKTSPDPVALIDGVDMLQIQYGVDIDDTAAGTVDRYVTYSNLAANAAWFDRVKAIKIGMILSNSQESATGNTNTEDRLQRTYTVLDGTLTANDSILRRAITTTVFLPNSSNDI